MKPLMLIAWPFVVIWAFSHVGFAFQVIDPVRMRLDNQAACAAMAQPFENGGCDVKARAEGRLDRMWTLTSPVDGSDVVLIEPKVLIYSADDWHFKGGKVSGIGLALLALLIAGWPIGVYLLGIMKRVSEPTH